MYETSVVRNLSLVFLTFFLILGANVRTGMLARLGFDADILLATLVALTLSGLVFHRHIALIVLMSILMIGANLPQEVAGAIGYDPDYLLGTLIALVVVPQMHPGGGVALRTYRRRRAAAGRDGRVRSTRSRRGRGRSPRWFRHGLVR